MANVLVKPAARSLIVAPRMPNPPQGHPFNGGTGDIVLDCGVQGCGWHWMGPREFADRARKDHYAQFHASDQVAGLFRINDPRQDPR